MNIDTFLDIEKSLNDTRAAINEKQEYPEFFEHHLARLEWALDEINKLNKSTNCEFEQTLIYKRDLFIMDINSMKEAQ